MTYAPQPRPGLMAISPYVGGDSAEGAVNLASNENPLGAGPAARRAFVAEADRIHRYPDGGSVALREAIAAAHDLDAARIVCGAGSDELIGLLASAYAGEGDEVIHSEHGFLMYRICALAAGATPVSVPERALRTDVEAILAAVTPALRIVFLANPNNPTGSWLDRDALRRLADGLPERALLVLDAAYAEYVGDAEYEAGAALVETRPNVVMIRTFSKLHGLAALRVGWAYCPSQVADALHRARGPFNVSAPAQAAAAAALADRDHIEASLAMNARNREALAEAVGRLGLFAAPSAGNFLLVRFPDPAEARATDALLRAGGVYVRRVDAYGLPDCLRMTAGDDAATARLIELLSRGRAGEPT